MSPSEEVFSTHCLKKIEAEDINASLIAALVGKQ